MGLLWCCIAGFLLFTEVIYHIGSFGFVAWNPILPIVMILATAGILTLLIGVVKGVWQKIILHFFMWLSIVWTSAQIVYYHIFKQPLLLEAAIRGGGDALTNYWKETLQGILEVSPWILLLIAPGVVASVFLAKKKWELPKLKDIHLLRAALLAASGLIVCVTVMQVEKALKAQDYVNYAEFIDPMSVAEKSGVMPTTLRSISYLLGDTAGLSDDMAPSAIANTGYDPNASFQSTISKPVEESVETLDDNPEVVEEEPEPVVEILPHVFELDFDKMYTMADNKKKTWLADYVSNLKPDTTNDYTGILEGYNLIFLTAEGFSPYCLSEELTPTLYRLTHNGYYFENYYVPLWQTSTSDGEYINCTGLIPDGQFSMRRSAANAMPYALPGFFKPQGALCMAYHNNSLSYYDRHLSHPNLGYFFKACKLGNLDEKDWGDHIFEMEGAGHWPASDYNMMVATMDEYVNEDRFLTYYMTVSGHMNYNFAGNRQSARNKDAVEHLEMSENARAYIACHLELEKAMTYMLEKLEEAGKLDNTLIVLSADHYPYFMTDEQLEELSGKEDITYAKDKFRNSLVMWTPMFEENPQTITKACGSMDLLPTILNLFGFEYDSRMYAGRDIFSENEGLVIFNDRSYVTDRVICKKKEKEIIWLTDEEGNAFVPEEEQEAYLAYYDNEVKARYTFSAYVIQENFYKMVKECRIGGDEEPESEMEPGSEAAESQQEAEQTETVE